MSSTDDDLALLHQAAGDWTGPAALVRTSPWRLLPNAALRPWLDGITADQAAFASGFDGPAGTLAELLAASKPFSAHLCLPPTPDHPHERWLQADFAPLAEAGAWLAAFIDLTPSEAVKWKRSRTLDHLYDTLDRLQHYVTMVTHEERILFVNQLSASFYGTSRDQAIGKTLLEYMGPVNHAMSAPYRRLMFETGEPQSYERAFIRLNGGEQVASVTMHPILDAQGKLVRMAALSWEVTKRHQGLQAIRQTLQRLDALFEAGIEGILLCADGRVHDANPTAARYLGTQVEVLVGQPVPVVLAALGMPAEQARSCPALSWCRMPSPSLQAPLQVHGHEVLQEGRPCQVVLLQDMSYRVQAQQRIDRLVADLRQQTALAAAADRDKSMFLASASHDLRQPIHSLGLFLTTLQSLIRAKAPLEHGALQPIAQRMRISLQNLTQLLDALLGATLQNAEREPVQMRPVALQPIFDALVADFAPQALRKGLRLSAVPSRAWVNSDTVLLRRILANLVSNAVRYTERGRIVIGARRSGATLQVQVWDTGVGIAAEQIGAIFEAFHRIDPQPPRGERAEGLGLSIVQRAAQQLGAAMDVRSVPRRGSMFGVTQQRCEAPDLAASATPAPGAPVSAGSAAQRGLCVLLIDDDAQVRQATASLLKTWGHEVWVAASASEVLQRRAPRTGRIDAVICDYLAEAVLNELRALLDLSRVDGRRLPVCMVTGDVSPERLAQARQHDFSLLHKPVSAPDLQRFLEKVR